MLHMLNDNYQMINMKTEILTRDIAPYLTMTEPTNGFQFELPNKTKFDSDIKQLSNNAKEITNDIKVLKNDIKTWTDPTLKRAFEKKIAILIKKHHQNLKSLIKLTRTYPDVIIETANEYMVTDTDRETVASVNNDVIIDINQEIFSQAKEVSTLTSNIIELKEMFQEMSILIEYQNEQIEIVEIEIDNAKKRTSNGNKELRNVIVKQKNNRIRCCCLICIVLILFIIGVIIMGSFI